MKGFFGYWCEKSVFGGDVRVGGKTGFFSFFFYL